MSAVRTVPAPGVAAPAANLLRSASRRGFAHHVLNLWLWATVTLLATACASPGTTTTPGPTGGTPTPAVSPAQTPQAIAERVTVRFAEAAIEAELADEPDEWSTGLMFRTEMDADAGMLFDFDSAHSGGFWMKNTLIPLSIAFMSRQGPDAYRVEAILDMEPCREDPCPVYDPGVAYDAALEVNAGWFAEAGVAVGDTAAVDGAQTA